MKAPERIVEVTRKEYAELNRIIVSHQERISGLENELDGLRNELKSLKHEEAEMYRFLTANHVEIERGSTIYFPPQLRGDSNG